MIAQLQDRAAALMTHGWTRREAEWLALVCLHSGVFFRSQYLAFIGRTNQALANRFIRRCLKYAVKQPWNGSRLRLCRIAARRIYRVLGAEHFRHRRTAACQGRTKTRPEWRRKIRPSGRPVACLKVAVRVG